MQIITYLKSCNVGKKLQPLVTPYVEYICSFFKVHSTYIRLFLTPHTKKLKLKQKTQPFGGLSLPNAKLKKN